MRTQRRRSGPSLRRTLAATIALASLPAATMPAAFAGCPADFDGNGIVGGADLTPLLGAWGTRGGPADLDGNGIVGGGDLAMLLGAWGPCPVESCDGFVDLSFMETEVSLAPLGVPGVATISGEATVTPFGQEGMITVILPNGEPAFFDFHMGVQKVSIAGVTVDVAPFAPAGVVLVDGAPTPIPGLLDGVLADSGSGSPIGEWSPTSKASLAIFALIETPQWKCNVEAAIAFESGGDGAGNQSGWCKFWAYGAATAIAALAGGGCFALTGACAAGTVVTIGGVGIPCATLVGLCAGGTFAGTAAAYEAVLASWG